MDLKKKIQDDHFICKSVRFKACTVPLELQFYLESYFVTPNASKSEIKHFTIKLRGQNEKNIYYQNENDNSYTYLYIRVYINENYNQSLQSLEEKILKIQGNRSFKREIKTIKLLKN